MVKVRCTSAREKEIYLQVRKIWTCHSNLHEDVRYPAYVDQHDHHSYLLARCGW